MGRVKQVGELTSKADEREKEHLKQHKEMVEKILEVCRCHVTTVLRKLTSLL
jgi:hypothetical protein